MRAGVLLIAAALLIVLGPAFEPAPAQAASVSSVSSKIMCQCGCGAVLNQCPHQDCGWGVPAKQFIEQQLAAGKTPEELIEYYVSQNGEQVLAAPQKEGFGLTAWVTPFAVLISAGVGIYFLVRMWAAERRETPEALVPELRAPPEQVDRLEDELRRFD